MREPMIFEHEVRIDEELMRKRGAFATLRELARITLPLRRALAPFGMSIRIDRVYRQPFHCWRIEAGPVSPPVGIAANQALAAYGMVGCR